MNMSDDKLRKAVLAPLCQRPGCDDGTLAKTFGPHGVLVCLECGGPVGFTQKAVDEIVADELRLERSLHGES